MAFLDGLKAVATPKYPKPSSKRLTTTLSQERALTEAGLEFLSFRLVVCFGSVCVTHTNRNAMNPKETMNRDSSRLALLDEKGKQEVQKLTVAGSQIQYFLKRYRK